MIGQALLIQVFIDCPAEKAQPKTKLRFPLQLTNSESTRLSLSSFPVYREWDGNPLSMGIGKSITIHSYGTQKLKRLPPSNHYSENCTSNTSVVFSKNFPRRNRLGQSVRVAGRVLGIGNCSGFSGVENCNEMDRSGDVGLRSSDGFIRF